VEKNRSFSPKLGFFSLKMSIFFSKKMHILREKNPTFGENYRFFSLFFPVFIFPRIDDRQHLLKVGKSSAKLRTLKIAPQKCYPPLDLN